MKRRVERGKTRVESGERRTRVERGQTRVERGRTRVRRWAWKKRPCRPSGKRANASGKTEEVEREWGGGSGKSDPVGHGTSIVMAFFLQELLKLREDCARNDQKTLKVVWGSENSEVVWGSENSESCGNQKCVGI